MITRFICRHWYAWPRTESKLAETRKRIREAVTLFVVMPLSAVAGAVLAAVITWLLFFL